MHDQNLVISKLEGYSGIQLKNDKPLTFRPGINLLVGRNGCGKTNLLRLVQLIATSKGDLKNKVESSYFIDRLKGCKNKSGNSIEEKFGKVTIVKHRLRGKSGDIKLILRQTNAEYVLNNIIKDVSGFSSHLELICKTEPVTHRSIYGSDSPPKIEMSGYIMSSRLFSQEHDNKVHSLMSGPIQSVSDFIKARLSEFFTSEEFVSRMTGLETEINLKFKQFLGTANKKIKINYSDIANSGRVALTITDNENYIQSNDFSTGESILFNLVFSLSLAKVEGCDILSLDEPDIHMHDDMIQVLVNELSELSRSTPNCIIIIASHSTALIEKLAALGNETINIITFDSERNVGNSNNDIELINALHRNGVVFSPLMLSRRLNIFIENKFQKEDANKDLFSKFFTIENMPNIVPIGFSGNVQESDSFAEVIQEILKISHIRSIGIQDGDIWLKPQLSEYLSGKSNLSGFIKTLKSHRGIYIKVDKKVSNSYFFNCWEIENLFLMDELLACWNSKNKHVLTKETYLKLLFENKEVIIREYLDSFFKSLIRIRSEKSHSIEKRRDVVSKKFVVINDCLSDEPSLRTRLTALADAILDAGLLHWIPGKEIKNLLEKKGYVFDDSQFDYGICKLSKHVQKII